LKSNEIIFTYINQQHPKIDATDLNSKYYIDDIEIVKMLLLSSNRYVGVLSSRQRIERLLADLRAAETIYTDNMLEKLQNIEYIRKLNNDSASKQSKKIERNFIMG
jgi:hypothetical protein